VLLCGCDKTTSSLVMGADCRRNSLPAIKLSELAGSEDVCSDQQHALADLVHTGQFILFARFLFAMLDFEQPQV
jgi:hypothetical protein